ncbi:MAG: hypothetical protein ABIS86_05295 [Streptosporangiaceae bacterium]
MTTDRPQPGAPSKSTAKDRLRTVAVRARQAAADPEVRRGAAAAASAAATALTVLVQRRRNLPQTRWQRALTTAQKAAVIAADRAATVVPAQAQQVANAPRAQGAGAVAALLLAAKAFRRHQDSRKSHTD